MGDDTAVVYNKPFGIPNSEFSKCYEERLPVGKSKRPEECDTLLATKDFGVSKGGSLTVDYVSKLFKFKKSRLYDPRVMRNASKRFTNTDVHFSNELGVLSSRYRSAKHSLADAKMH